MYLWNDPSATIVRAAREANKGMPNYAVSLLQMKIGSLKGKRVAVLGATYRGGVKETAFSGVFDVVESLNKAGALPLVHDPMYSDDELSKLGLEIFHLGDMCDAVILQNYHSEYKKLTKQDVPGAEHIIDGRRVLTTSITSSIPTTVLGASAQ
jgi:UDP-N-acetyl-D-mannosaminuronate dehydrogenase